MTLLSFILIIISAVFHASWNLAAKKAAGNLYVIFLGLIVASIVFLPFAIFAIPDGLFTEHLYRYILATGLLHTIYFTSLSKAYVYGDISVVYPVARGVGIVGTALLAATLLKEQISVVGMLSILLIIVGIIMVSNEKTSSSSTQKNITLGSLLPLIVGACIVGYSLIDKQAVEHIDPLFYIFGLYSCTALFMGLFMLKKQKELKQALKTKKRYILTIGVGSALVYLLVLFVLQDSQVSYVVALREVAVAFGALLGFWLLKEKPTLQKVIGIGAIVVGAILVKLA